MAVILLYQCSSRLQRLKSWLRLLCLEPHVARRLFLSPFMLMMSSMCTKISPADCILAHVEAASDSHRVFLFGHFFFACRKPITIGRLLGSSVVLESLQLLFLLVWTVLPIFLLLFHI